VDLSAGASVGMEYNSNPFEFETIEAYLFNPRGLEALDDTALTYMAGFAGKVGKTGPLVLQVQGSYRHTETAHFDKLGHDDYNVAGVFDWKPAKLFDATLSADQTRTPMRQADVGADEATQKTARQVKVTGRLHPTPHWQLAVMPGWNHIDVPLPGGRGYEFHETVRGASITYTGAARLAPGVDVQQSEATNRGVDAATRYHQRTIWAVLNYEASGFSTFTLSAGHTRRETHLLEPSTDPAVLANEGVNAGFTGLLGYKRQLSVKTSVYINAFRAFQQYDAGTNLSVDTGFSTGIAWLPTRKIGVKLDSQNTWSTIVGLTGGLQVPVPGGRRRDMLRSVSLEGSYNFTRIVAVRAYVTRRIRRSEAWSAQFNATIGGVELKVAFD
jgi:hypothetical protein